MLEELRAELDRIDETLLAVLRERLECCLRIGDYKRLHRVEMMQPHRISAVHERAASYGAAHGIDPGFLRQLYDLIIAETCRLEELVIQNGGTDGHADTPH